MTSQPSPLSWRQASLFYLIGILLIGTWLLPPTRIVWDFADQWALEWNRSLATRPWQQVFWALSNHRLVELSLIGLLAIGHIAWIFKAHDHERQNRLLQCTYILLAVFFGAALCKNGVASFLHKLGYFRSSPTLTEQEVVHLGKAIPHLTIKYGSTESFPGDHAMVSLLWASLFTFFQGWSRGRWAFIGAAVWALPRLAGATHWLSDCLVGSTSVACFIAPLWMTAPLYPATIGALLRLSHRGTSPITPLTPLASEGKNEN